VESFNISVAAALVMYEARSQRQRTLGHHGDLTPAEVRFATCLCFCCSMMDVHASMSQHMKML
jgi:hypothetical protein